MNPADLLRIRDGVPIPDPITKANGDPITCTCPICGAMNIGAPPHGTGEPCPWAKSVLEARLRETDAMQWLSNDMTQFFKKMGVIPTEED